MSGGYFDRSTYAMCEIADTIERDIARALQPKPEKVYENYWTIYEKDSFGSYHSYKDYISFASYEDAESFLLLDKTIVKAEQKYADRRFFDDGVVSNQQRDICLTLQILNKFRYYTQYIIVIMTIIRMKRMCWNCPIRQ